MRFSFLSVTLLILLTSCGGGQNTAPAPTPQAGRPETPVVPQPPPGPRPKPTEPLLPNPEVAPNQPTSQPTVEPTQPVLPTPSVTEPAGPKAPLVPQPQPNVVPTSTPTLPTPVVVEPAHHLTPEPNVEPEPSGCARIYKKGSEIGYGRTAKVYDVDPRENWGSKPCWLKDCSLVVVREVLASKSSATHLQIAQQAADLGVGVPVIQSGHCESEGHSIEYVISPKLAPIDAEHDINADPKGFALRVQALLDKLHENDILHGDAHLGNFLKDPRDHNRLYMTDFDHARSLAGSQGKLGDAAYENFLVRGLWEKRAPWQPFVYKYLSFDSARNGQIKGKEVEKLSSALGNYNQAVAVAELYAFRMKLLPLEFHQCAYDDFNQDGIIEQSEATPQTASCASHYADLTSRWKKNNAFFAPSDNPFRMISNQRQYTDQPLVASDILIISGGDITPNRQFPLLTRENFAQFARNHGYRFQSNDSSFMLPPYVGYWNKIMMLADMLADPKNRVVVWFDDDGVVDVNSDMIEQYLHAYPSKDLIIAMDPEQYAYVNTGAIILRNTKNTVTLLNELVRIGKEGRIEESDAPRTNWFTSEHLLRCKQEFWCLHEQQALQELLQGNKRVYDRYSSAWHHSSSIKRSTSFDANKFVQVVPQIDEQTGRNMNLLLKEGFYVLEGRYSQNTNHKIPFRGLIPFFVQCGGAKDKKSCVENVIREQKGR